MKQKRPERVERRRPLVELNLIGEKVRAGVRRRGCLPFGVLAIVLGSAMAIAVGLHLS